MNIFGFRLWFSFGVLVSAVFCAGGAGGVSAGYTPLVPLEAPLISAASEDYSGGNHRVSYLIDGDPKTEYSSASKGLGTFVEFDFGRTVMLAGVKHVDRNDPATVAGARLLLEDESGRRVGIVEMRQANTRSGVSFQAFDRPMEVRRVRWEVTALGPHGYGTVGGAEMVFFEAGEGERVPGAIGLGARPVLRADRVEGGLEQPIRVVVDYFYREPLRAWMRLGEGELVWMDLVAGTHSVEVAVPVSEGDRVLRLQLGVEVGEVLMEREVRVPPFRKMTVHVLPHSHTDIGYTEIQTAIEEKQVNNLLAGMEAAERTAGYPDGARFVWNVEVLWAADLFLQRMGEPQRARFLDAVRSGRIALCGMYLNELTGLCRPEELVRLFRFATVLREQTGTALDTAMISDVPGYTWGTIPAMVEAGIRYFSVAPNYFDRIGTILVEWENKPFWWVGPDRESRVLVWIPFWGYAMSHRYGEMSDQLVEDFQAGLEQREYPYDIAYVRWAGHGDNATPDPAICEFIREWNERHAWPRFVISSASEAFHAFEGRYGAELPEVCGDWTPYWEDGAGSSAAETALNRASSDRVTQAEALWAMLGGREYPAEAFESAWRNVLLYSEHTWGAWCSVGEPSRKETLEQWSIKRSYAAAADLESRALLDRAAALSLTGKVESAVDIFNTASWDRTELVVLPRDFTEGRNRVEDAGGRGVPSQRLANGDLVMLASGVPALAGWRYAIVEGPMHREGEVRVEGLVMDNGLIRVELDPVTGGISSLRPHGLEHDFSGEGPEAVLNRYLYLQGDDVSGLQDCGAVTIRVKEKGPLVASLLVSSEAPGCHRLEREIRLVAGLDHVEVINLVDKARLVFGSYHAREGKESVNFAFPFTVPGGQVRVEVPFGVVRPDVDQIPSACKNWFTMGRWADVSSDAYGVTWVSLDAPLVQVGGVTANLLNSQTDPRVWRREVGETQTLVSWSMNNHWGTNYRAYQEGPVVFRYILRPHTGYDAAGASRFAVAASQPLLPVRARGAAPQGESLLRVGPEQLLVTGLKPADDGRGAVVRIWNAGEDAVGATLQWRGDADVIFYRSDTSERMGERIAGSVVVPAKGLVTVRVEVLARTR